MKNVWKFFILIFQCFLSLKLSQNERFKNFNDLLLKGTSPINPLNVKAVKTSIIHPRLHGLWILVSKHWSSLFDIASYFALNFLKTWDCLHKPPLPISYLLQRQGTMVNSCICLPGINTLPRKAHVNTNLKKTTLRSG